MTHRFALAAVLVTAFAMPAAAQVTTTPTDTSKKVPTMPGDTTKRAPTMPGDTTKRAPTTTNSSGSVELTPAPVPAGQIRPSEAARVNVKVAESLASTAKISADSAFAIARHSPDSGEVSSADLQMASGRLVYQVKMLLPNKGASEVVVDAMTGEVLKDKKYGGAKAVLEHHEENKKLLDAKRDSSAMKKP
jgi:uncharacterized membrane protein YkoI